MTVTSIKDRCGEETRNLPNRRKVCEDYRISLNYQAPAQCNECSIAFGPPARSLEADRLLPKILGGERKCVVAFCWERYCICSHP